MSPSPRHARLVRLVTFMVRSAMPMRDAMEAFPVADGEELTEAWLRSRRVPRRSMWIHRNEDIRRRVLSDGPAPRGAA